MDGLLSLGSIPLACLLNRSVARIGNLGLLCVDLSCNKDKCMSALVLQEFCMVLLTNFMHTSACLLL